MDLFHVIDEKTVILRSNGVFRQAKAYRRGNALYAGHASGFVRLLAKPNTSSPNVSWEETDVPHKCDALNRPVLGAI
ncbi:hypothetical protein [EBPR siphovirus 2]|nr:hypothetical protein [EBPR siphovirus 2]